MPSLDTVQTKISLKKFTSWKVGGNAEFYVRPKNLEELQQALCWAKQESLEITVLSGGSNVLISDSGVKGLVLHLSDFSQITNVVEKENKIQVECLSGTSKARVFGEFLKHKCSQSLFLAGLPGDMGGGVVMNAGVNTDYFPKEFCEIVDWIEVIKLEKDTDFNPIRLSSSEILWSYRNSKGWQPGIITKMGVSLNKDQSSDLIKKLRNSIKIRSEKQPLKLATSGSTFKNPVGDFAGSLIESAGLKGFKIGQAEVSRKHANFIVAHSGAKASEIYNLICYIQKEVFKKHFIQLKPEVVFIGQNFPLENSILD